MHGRSAVESVWSGVPLASMHGRHVIMEQMDCFPPAGRHWRLFFRAFSGFPPFIISYVAVSVLLQLNIASMNSQLPTTDSPAKQDVSARLICPSVYSVLLVSIYCLLLCIILFPSNITPSTYPSSSLQKYTIRARVGMGTMDQ